MGKGGKGTKIADNEMQKELGRISKAKWRHYNELSKPAEVKWVNDIKTMNNEAQYQQQQAQANAAVANAADQQIQQRLSQGGNAGRLNAAINQGAIGRGQMQQDTTNRMEVNQQKQYLGGLAAANAVGSGKGAQAIQVGQGAAENANQYALGQARSAAQKNNDRQQMIGMGLGAAGNYAADKLGSSYNQAKTAVNAVKGW
ncbi:hypothetical protein [Photobacterium damselae]|uniref:hypothetical protein n=1 Tax=Photobacterium damselae TaxID=38293 RepID=UPI001F2A1221|nr:hypothetical protein [Photobacterium damselae]UKA12940.1 hypothetical protein IHC91_21380 [Photobacterium damselae subsp. damselae]